MTYKVEKKLDGYSICFRQWQATHSHCQFLHGYSISFKLYFEAEQLDQHNWVWDFGWLKDAKYQIDGMSAKAWFDYMFDHTTIIAADDPQLETFKQLDKQGVIQLRVIPKQSCERMAEFVYEKIAALVSTFSNNQARLTRVDVFEHDRNCAGYQKAHQSR